MTGLTRRAALRGAGAVVAMATVAVPAVQAADPEEAQVLAVFRQLNDGQRATVHLLIRSLAGLPRDPALWARSDRGLARRREVGS